MKVGRRILEDRALQLEKAGDVPLLDVRLAGIDIEREVEEIRHDDRRWSGRLERGGLQDVESFEDQDVGAGDRDRFARHDVVALMRIDRRAHLRLASLDIGQKLDHPPAVVALGKTLALHQAAFDQRGVGIQKAVGGHQGDRGMVGPAGQQRLQRSRKGALADCDAAGNADHIGASSDRPSQELVLDARQRARRSEMQVEQARQWQVNLRHIIERDLLEHTLQRRQLFLRQRQRCVVAQACPFVAVENHVGRVFGAGISVHGGELTAGARRPLS